MSSEKPSSQPIPDRLLERLALGELPPAQAKELMERLREEEGGEARLARLRADDQAILEELPPRVMAARILDRMRRPRRTLARASWLLAPALVAGLYLFIPGISSDVSTTAPLETGDGIRIKGMKPRLQVHLQTQAGSENLEPEALLEAGEVLQIGVIPAGRRHGLVLSIDGRGGSSLHFPAAPGESTRLPQGGETLLPQAWELDDAPEFERFFLVTSDDAIQTRALMMAADALARDPERARRDPLPIDTALEQTSFLVRKP